MGQADLSSFGPLLKPMMAAAAKLTAPKGKDDKGAKKATLKTKIKATVKAKRG
jgi:hypothetical protein